MDPSRITESLLAVLSSYPPERPIADLRAEIPTPIRYVVPDDLVREFVVGTALEPSLRLEPPFDSGGILISHGYGGPAFGAPQAGRYLVRRVDAGVTPVNAVSELEALLNTTVADCMAVLPLWGIAIDDSVVLADGFTLWPFQLLPDSYIKSRFEQQSALQSHPWMTPVSYPPCALSYRFSVSKVAQKQGDELVFNPDQEWMPPQKLREVAFAIGALGPFRLTPGPSWYQFVDPYLERFVTSVSLVTQLDAVGPSQFHAPVTIDAEAAKDIVVAYLRTAVEMRKKLRLSLERFNRGMSYSDVGAQALDLVIALEALLVDTPGENVFKISLRAALLTEGSSADQMRARYLVKALYDIRSDVAHNGQTKPKVKVSGMDWQPTSVVVDQGAELTATILRRVVNDGAIPVWPTFELGIGSTSSRLQRDWPLAYCDRCEQAQPVRTHVMPADASTDHDAMDLRCGVCDQVIATLHQPSQTPME